MFHTAEDGTRFRDLNHNGVLDPYEDPRLSVEERVDDLVPRLSLEELCGLLFHTVIETGPGVRCWTGPAGSARPAPGSLCWPSA